MQNIIDYLEWRGDLSFAQDGFNEVDNLIMSVLAYLEFDGIVPPDPGRESISLYHAAQRFRKTMKKPSSLEHNPFFKQIPNLLSKAAQTTRYRDIQLSGFLDQIDYENAKQFSAIIFSINSEQHFIAFRGTDDTLIGWQENLLMSFMDEVPAQKQAVIYMNRIFSNMAGNFYMGGHSKGGNLAVYAAIHAAENNHERIIAIYNNDGPGFQKDIIQSKEYQSILGKIRTFIPNFSVVGMLLEHGEEYKVVGSCETGLMQHDAFSWQVKGANFVYEKGLTKRSRNLNSTVRAWLDQLSMEERERFVDALFEIIQATGAATVGELSKEKLVVASKMIKTYKNMDTMTQVHLKRTIEIFFEESQKTFKNSISKDIGILLMNRKSGKAIRNNHSD